MRRLFLLVSPCFVALAACGGDGNADGSGTGDTTSATDITTTAPTTSATTSMTTSMTTGETDVTTDMTTTMTTDPDTSGSGSTTDTDTDTDTGVPACPYTEVGGRPALGLQLVANGFVKPVHAVGDPTQPDRLFVTDQTGFVKILEPGMNTAPADTFLEVDSIGAGNSDIGSELGLLGFALHPDFPDDPRVYIAWNPADGPLVTRVTEFTLMAGDPNHADPASERTIIDAPQPAGNHNGGMIAFGPDGYLYFGLGDGGGSDDQFNNGRDTGTILAKILRIDVTPSGGMEYTVPPDNPFVGDNNFAPEIWAWGFRNPWRFSFDLANGDLYVADVGQNIYEEIDIVVAGADYGWSDMEGAHCFQGASCDVVDTPNAVNADGMTMPISEYTHDGGRCSITGGGVYRSCEVPAWDGLYLYADVCSREMLALVWDGAAVQEFDSVLDTETVLGNGWNAWGDVYLTAADGVYGGPSADGLIYRVAPM